MKLARFFRHLLTPPWLPLRGFSTALRAEIAAAALPLAYGMPVRVDVVLRILTPDGARGLRRLEALPAADVERQWWSFVERESRVFVRAFRLPPPTP